MLVVDRGKRMQTEQKNPYMKCTLGNHTNAQTLVPGSYPIQCYSVTYWKTNSNNVPSRRLHLVWHFVWIQVLILGSSLRWYLGWEKELTPHQSKKRKQQDFSCLYPVPLSLWQLTPGKLSTLGPGHWRKTNLMFFSQAKPIALSVADCCVAYCNFTSIAAGSCLVAFAWAIQSSNGKVKGVKSVCTIFSSSRLPIYYCYCSK